jgi:hypothetical protein
METSPVLWVINAAGARHLDIGDLFVVCVGGLATPELASFSSCSDSNWCGALMSHFGFQKDWKCGAKGYGKPPKR